MGGAVTVLYHPHNMKQLRTTIVWFQNLSVIVGSIRKVGKVSYCFLDENSFLTVRGNQRQFCENTVLGIDGLIVHSLIVMYHLHLLLCHIQLYEKMTTFGELEVLGRKCNGIFQSKQTSERLKPQSFYTLSWLRFKLATLKIQVTSIIVEPTCSL